MMEANPKKRHAGRRPRPVGQAPVALAVRPLEARLATADGAGDRQALRGVAGGRGRRGAPDPVELVDFTGKVVNKDKLLRDAKALEDKVRADVGFDNRQVHPLPLPPPKLIKKIIDRLIPEDKGWKKPKPQSNPDASSIVPASEVCRPS